MARSVASAIENNFVKGLITEATGLQYPENSLVGISNCVVDHLGAVERRAGFDLEYNHTTHTADLTGSAISTHQWRNVTGDGSVSLLVVQIGATLYFYDMSNTAITLSQSLLASTVNLTAQQIAGTPEVRLAECQFADGLSKLYVVHPSLNNFYVTYAGGALTVTPYTLKVRDLEGVTEAVADDNRPTTLTDSHKYNLLNQGWDDTKITTWHTAESNYPSNCDVWWLYKDVSDVFNPSTTAANVSRGNTRAPNGHYILPLYTNDRNAASGLSGLSVTAATSATSSVAFFAGRVWYSGIQSSGFNSKVYFSQIIVRDAQIGECYQACDPTSETLFDLLPDDGGVITIPEAGTIYRMLPVGNSLLIFAYHGVWQLTGSTGLGFTAVDFVLNKLSSIRTTSPSSFVDVNGYPLWWNPDGIWSISPAQSGGLQVQSLTRSTIQTFYDNIPNASKTTARGAFNTTDQVVTWLYSTESPTTVEEQYEFNAALSLNTVTGAFYPWVISPGAKIHSISAVDSLGGSTAEDVIVDEAGDTVVTDAGDTVVGYALTNLSFGPRPKFFVSYESSGSQFTFADANDISYVDWASLPTPVSYESYFLTGYKLHAQANKNFQSNYATLYNEGRGTVYFQGVWDYAITGNTGRYTVKQLADFNSLDYATNMRRLKVRGQGKALQYKVTSLPNQPFRMVGWATWETGNTTP